MVYVAKITSKGQMTLPIAVRKSLGVDAGHHVRIEETADGDFVLKAQPRARELLGIVRYDGPSLTVEEIRAASRATMK